jgi:hypothetical protein
MRRTGIATALLAAGIALALAGCGSSSKKASSHSLNNRLLPVGSVPGFRLLRQFDWSNEINLAGEGIVTPEATHPADVVKAIRDAGFVGGSGEQLSQGVPPNENDIVNGVVKLNSASGAKKLQAYMHAQNLQQPCFTACIYFPASFAIPGVPGVTAVQQVPHVPVPPGAKAPPAGQGPPYHYLVEFTVGPYLYFATGDGDAATKARVAAVVQAYYKRVAALK